MKYTIYNILYRVFYTEEIIHVRNNIPRVYLFIVLSIGSGLNVVGSHSAGQTGHGGLLLSTHTFIYLKKSIF